MGKLRPDDAIVYPNPPDIFYRTGRTPKFDDAYHPVIEKNPTLVRPYFGLANILGRLTRYWDAETLLREVIKIQPNAEEYFVLGMCLNYKNKPLEAEQAFLSVCDLASESYEAHIVVGESLINLRKFNQAELIFRKAFRLKSDAASSNWIGAALFNQGKNDEAAKLFQQAIRMDPTFRMAYYNLGYVLEGAGKYEAAAALYRQACKAIPTEYQLCQCLGRIMLQLGDDREAEDAFREAVKRNSEFLGGLHDLASVLVKRKMYKEAEAIARHAVQICPDSFQYNMLGSILILAGRNEEAAIVCRRAIEVKKDNAWGYMNLAELSDHMGKPQEALEMYKRAFELDPTISEAQNQILKHTGRTAGEPSPPLEMASAARSFPVSVGSSPRLRWCLALGAVLAKLNLWKLDLLGGVPESFALSLIERYALSNSWGITSKKDLFHQLKWLETKGDHQEFQQMRARLKSLSAQDIERVKQFMAADSEFCNRIDQVIQHGDELGESGILAWDMGRYVHLCNAGYRTGLLDADEAWQLIIAIAITTQKTFSSWKEFSRSYVIGREFWSLEQTKKIGAEVRAVVDSLLSAPDSPWTTLPWNTDLQTNDHYAFANPFNDLEKNNEVEAAYREAIKLKPVDAEGYGIFAGFLERTGKKLEAVDMYRKAIELKPDFAPSYFALAHVFNGLKRFDDEEGILRDAVKVQATAESYNALGICLRNENKALDAEQAFRSGCDLATDSYDLHMSLGGILLGLKKFQEAEAAYRTAFRLKGDAFSANALGCTLLNHHKNDEAAEMLRTAIRLDPTLRSAYCNLACLLESTGKLQEAVVLCHQACDAMKNEYYLCQSMGKFLFRLGNVAEAEDAFREAVRRNPQFFDGHCDLAGILLKREKDKEAEAVARRALQIKPEYFMYNMLGGILMKQGRNEESAAVYRQSIEVVKDNAWGYYGLGQVSERMGRPQEALKMYMRAVELDPTLIAAKKQIKKLSGGN